MCYLSSFFFCGSSTASIRPTSTACSAVRYILRSVYLAICSSLIVVCSRRMLFNQIAHAQDLARFDLDVGGLTLHAAQRLVQVDGRVGQRITLALAPAVNRIVPMLAAMPMAMVDTGAVIMRIVS